ncbi:hypothetical protein GCM10010129_40630 [Streptomyces fumigatiscleroticus]|nr:hypothetical protein GCM10010129_40630 [Streptomyces fumigatiscleroticus]
MSRTSPEGGTGPAPPEDRRPARTRAAQIRRGAGQPASRPSAAQISRSDRSGSSAMREEVSQTSVALRPAV